MGDAVDPRAIFSFTRNVNERTAIRDIHPNPQFHPNSQFAYALSIDISESGDHAIPRTSAGGSAPVPTRYDPRCRAMSRDSIGDISSAGSPVFDHDHYSEYTTDASSAPSRRGDVRNPPPIPSPSSISSQLHGVNAPERFLPCELSGFGCLARFPIYRVSDWIRHLEGHHLLNTFPSNSLCWFCSHPDDDEFKAASDSYDDRKSAFQRRMQHIAAHYERGESEGRRPDWHMLYHLRNMNSIGRDQFDQATRFSEDPFGNGVNPIDRNPPTSRYPIYLQQDRGQCFRKRMPTNYRPKVDYQ